MFTRILSWTWRGQPIHSLFHHAYVRRWHRGSRKFRLVPQGTCTLEDLTAEEVGQLMGGN